MMFNGDITGGLGASSVYKSESVSFFKSAHPFNDNYTVDLCRSINIPTGLK